MSAFLRALSRRIRLAIHRHDPIECWCEPSAPWQDPRPIFDAGRGGFRCAFCWTPSGERHELSCPEVSLEQYHAFLRGQR